MTLLIPMDINKLVSIPVPRGVDFDERAGSTCRAVRIWQGEAVSKTILETQNLMPRIPIEADLEGWARLDADERAMRFIGGKRTRADAWMSLAAATGMWALRGFGLFSVVDKATGQWIGRVSPWVPEGAPGTEVGWTISPSEWGRGRAAEAATSAIDWAFDHLGWTDVIHCIDAENLASIALAQRLGSTWSGEYSGADGKPLQIYGQSQAAWRARRHTGP
jgi:RimJ/RimL family protein N-acetyltransferase